MQITLNLPNDFVTLQSPVEIEQDMRLSYALWLFKYSKVTLSKAAELAELNIYDFISACKKNDVAVIGMTKEESGRVGKRLYRLPTRNCRNRWASKKTLAHPTISLFPAPRGNAGSSPHGACGMRGLF